MKVFKFGGASVKDANAVKNVAKIIKENSNENLVVVISAMGKTTNKLEAIIEAYFKKDDSHLTLIESTLKFHLDICAQLFENQHHTIANKVASFFDDCNALLTSNENSAYNFIYDQVVCIGELVSTTIVSEYLKSINVANKWLDARQVVKTDKTFREGKINWEITSEKIIKTLKTVSLVITQGFIASEKNGFTTTLGREGSDFSGAIFANALNANSLSIWKDVPGILTGDPKKIEDPILIKQLSYRDAVEMTYYGATVIHPKTIKPLQNANIPLIVRPFTNPKEDGTIINAQEQNEEKLPVVIHKSAQVLLTISTRNYSFMAESNLSFIIAICAKLQIKINVFQKAATSTTICFDDTKDKKAKLINALKNDFEISERNGLNILTIRNYNENAKSKYAGNLNWIIEQQTQDIYQIVY